MAYCFKKNETVADGVRRIAVEELTSAIAGLSRSSPRDRETAIHEARKSVKKTRALLRLMQTELGQFFERDNLRLQKIGRKLSDIRDAEAIIETFEHLVKQYGRNVQGRPFRSMRAELKKRKLEKEKAARLSTALPALATSLRSIARGVDSWPLKQDGFAALEPGLRQTFKRGRSAMKVARKHPDPDNFHRWRKRTKDHWYHVRLLESIWTKVMEARESSLKKLETWLGDDHNLVLLCEQIKDGRGNFGRAEDIDLFLALASKTQNELRKEALSVGEKTHGEKPRTMLAGLSHLWDAWQAEPQETAVEQRKQNRPKGKRAV
ncbi:MAG TPA: CHAD domain-containing protein [Bryobacteraceae bacterium]|nr:CHAD domain-containing protein [Bryobacteraceae bacterium]